MSATEPTLLNCPTCGAPLDFDGLHPVVRCKFCGNTSVLPAALTAQPQESSSVLEEISRLVSSGSLDAAVERYRGLFEVDDEEAREAINALSAGRVVSASMPGDHTRQELIQIMQQVQRLLQNGDELDAIKLYRQNFDMDLAHAKYAVEQIAAAQRPDQGSLSAFAMPAPANRQKNRVIALAVSVILVAAVFTGIMVLWKNNAFAKHYYPGGPNLLIASAQDTGSKVAGAFYDSDADENFVGLLDASHNKLLWKTGALEEGGVTLVQGGDLIYTANGANLSAYKIADGTLVWQAEMKDSLNYGDVPLLVTAGRVIADTADQSITAYDAASGDLIWNRKTDYTDRSLRLMGDSLVVVDSNGDSSGENLFFLDPVSGSQQQRLTLVCTLDNQDSQIDSDTGLVYDAKGNALYLVFEQGCVQRIDLAGKQQTWNSVDENTFNFLYEGFTPLISDTDVYFSNGSDLVQVTKSDGAIKTLVSNPDYRLVPLVQDKDTLIVRAKRTRGTTRFELWGIDAATGSVTWQKVLEKAEPIDPPDEMAGLVDDNDWAFTWYSSADGLVLLTFSGEPNQLTLETLNPDDGTSRTKHTLSLSRVSGDFYSIPSVISWQGNVVFLNIDSNLYQLDVSTNELKVIY
jgi:outer membrane protein assembly factor BamB